LDISFYAVSANAEGNEVTWAFLDHLPPLIGDPIPEYVRLEKHFVKKLF
jgi:hypothetical protein